MYANEISATMIEDKRRSMRTSAFIHALIILLAILPFLKSPQPPKPYQQAILVEFEKGGSSEGSKSAAANENEAAAASEASASETVEEVAEEPERVTEVKPVESTPSPSVLTSKIEPPVIKQTKVRKVEVKTTPKPTSTIPQQTKVEEVPTPTQKVVLKPSKTKKVVVKVERPTPKKGKGKGTGSSSASTKSNGSGSGDGKASSGGNGTGGSGSSSDGDGNDGNGKGEQGDGDGSKGNGEGNGEGDDVGDGILTRTLIKYPDFGEIIKESGTISVNLCADRAGKVTFVEFNKAHSTIKDMDVIRQAVSYAKDYLFEPDPTAPERECGRATFKITIEE